MKQFVTEVIWGAPLMTAILLAFGGLMWAAVKWPDVFIVVAGITLFIILARLAGMVLLFARENAKRRNTR